MKVIKIPACRGEKPIDNCPYYYEGFGHSHHVRFCGHPKVMIYADSAIIPQDAVIWDKCPLENA